MKDKILDEKTFRHNLMNEARAKGCEKELILLFQKFDKLIRTCTNPIEREHIAKLGVIEVHKLIDNGYVGKGGSLVINGETVIKE